MRVLTNVPTISLVSGLSKLSKYMENMNERLERKRAKACFKEEYPEAAQLIGKIRDLNLTYCGFPKLENICKAIHYVHCNQTPGIYVEAGCALGGSAVLIGKLKPPNTPLYIYDVFGMIPAPSERDGADAHARYAEIANGKSSGLGGHQYYGYMNNLKDVVVKNLESFDLDLDEQNIQLFSGLFQDTLILEEPVAFAHIDCDWYDSVKTCINRIVPRMKLGAAIVFDDYNSYSGCKLAVDELLSEGNFTIFTQERSIVLLKVSKDDEI